MFSEGLKKPVGLLWSVWEVVAVLLPVEFDGVKIHLDLLCRER